MGTLFAKLWQSTKIYFRQFTQRLNVRTFPNRLSESDVTADLATSVHVLASVIIPALNEEKAIASVIQYALSDPATGEVIVVDDSSIDRTVEIALAAGATVITSSMLGKGISMRDGMSIAQHAFVVFLDGDLSGLQPNIISDMIKPLRLNQADFVKAKFGRGGGRVTELTAKPMLKVFFPELSHFSQPLGGIISGRVSLFKNLSFEAGYGVDIGLLIGAFRKGARLAEVDIGALEHESQPLTDLTSMAFEVSRVIHHYSREAGRLHVEQINEMYENQRQAVASFEYVLTRQKDRTKLLLLDMDVMLCAEGYLDALAAATDTTEALTALRRDTSLSDTARNDLIAALFKFVHRSLFERVASALALKPGVIDFVNQMRRQKFMVGVVSNHFFAGTEIIRKRLFADFALSHVLQFQNEICTGKRVVNTAFLSSDNRTDSVACKSHVIRHFKDKTRAPLFNKIWVIGSSQEDIQLCVCADRAFVLDSNNDDFLQHPHIQQISSFTEILALQEVSD